MPQVVLFGVEHGVVHILSLDYLCAQQPAHPVPKRDLVPFNEAPLKWRVHKFVWFAVQLRTPRS